MPERAVLLQYSTLQYFYSIVDSSNNFGSTIFKYPLVNQSNANARNCFFQNIKTEFMKMQKWSLWIMGTMGLKVWHILPTMVELIQVAMFN